MQVLAWRDRRPVHRRRQILRTDRAPARTTVRLTEGEVRASDALAAARAAYRGATVPLGFTGIGLEDGHRLGTRAELAVAKYLNIFPQIGVDAAKDIPDWDLKTSSGLTIEVKFRRPAGGDFALNNNRWASFKADIGVLVWPTPSEDEGELCIAGWMFRADFVDNAYEGNLGRGPRLIYPTAKLRPADELRSRWWGNSIEEAA